MSEKKYKSNSAAPLVATVIVAVAAVAAVVILLVMMNGGKESPASDADPGFVPSAELVEECRDNAHDLAVLSYEVIKLFVTEGLPYKEEPYGNPTEDGLYTVNSEKYTSIADIEALVGSVYTDAEAERILHKMKVKTEGGAESEMEIYKERDVFGDKFLGINENFKPDGDYKTDWSNCLLKVVPKSESSCIVTVYVNGISEEEASAHPESVLETEMVKQDGVWRFAEMLL